MKCDHCQCAACTKVNKCSRRHCLNCTSLQDLRLWNVNTPGWKLCRGFQPNPLRFVRQSMKMDYHYYIIKIVRGLSEVDPEIQPNPGTYLLGMEGRKSDTLKIKHTGKEQEWCIIPYKGMKICIRNKSMDTEENEFEIILRI